jgi:hypothetical protein
MGKLGYRSFRNFIDVSRYNATVRLPAFWALISFLVWAPSAYANNIQDVYGRLKGEPGETLYLGSSADDAEAFAKLRAERARPLPSLDDPNRLEDARSVVKGLVGMGRLVPVPTGSVLYRLAKKQTYGIEDSADNVFVWKVQVLTGPQKGLVGFTPVFASLSPEPGERCWVYADDGYKFAFGAFDYQVWSWFWEAIDKGDKDTAMGWLRGGRVIAVRPVVTGRCEDVDHDLSQVRLTSGKDAGKMLWFDSENVLAVNLENIRKTVKNPGLKPREIVPRH